MVSRVQIASITCFPVSFHLTRKWWVLAWTESLKTKRCRCVCLHLVTPILQRLSTLLYGRHPHGWFWTRARHGQTSDREDFWDGCLLYAVLTTSGYWYCTVSCFCAFSHFDLAIPVFDIWRKKGGKGRGKKTKWKLVVDLDVSCDVVLAEHGLAHILSTLAKN